VRFCPVCLPLFLRAIRAVCAFNGFNDVHPECAAAGLRCISFVAERAAFKGCTAEQLNNTGQKR